MAVLQFLTNPANIYLFRVDNRNIRKSEICSKLTVKATRTTSEISLTISEQVNFCWETKPAITPSVQLILPKSEPFLLQ